jgi:anaerobic C4-dicarboxylate transporter
MEAVKANKANTKKEQMLEALERSLGIVTTACTAVGVGRTTHYQWMKDDPEYKRAVKDIENRTLDFAESHLHKLIKDGNPAATIFFLKTKGKARGYVERQEIEVAEKKPLSWFVGDDSTIS